MDGVDQLSDRLAAVERWQKQASRRLRLLWAVLILQAAAIAYLVLPFEAVKHPLTLQAGRFEAIDRNGNVRAVLTADFGQTMLQLKDAAGKSQILLRENDTGFATMEFFDRRSHYKTMTLFAGPEWSFLELHDPTTRELVNIQAGNGELGLFRLNERRQLLP